jgi:hypothetical protein
MTEIRHDFRVDVTAVCADVAHEVLRDTILLQHRVKTFRIQ